MAQLSGKTALVEYGAAGDAVKTALNNWTLDVDTNMLETTVFTTAAPQWRTFVAGLSGWSGTVSGHFNVASTALDDMHTNILTPTTSLIHLIMDQTEGSKFYGSCLLSRGSWSANIDGTVDVSFDYQGSGTLNYATTT